MIFSVKEIRLTRHCSVCHISFILALYLWFYDPFYHIVIHLSFYS